MHTYTALYDSRQEAEAAQARLEQLGILDADRYGITDQTNAGFSGQQGSSDSSSGSGHRSLWDRILGAAPPADDRRLYESHVQNGGYLLTVDVDETEADQVREVLDASGALDVDERERDLRERGMYSGATAQMTDQTGDIQLVEERLNVGKRMVERGTARVRSYVVETPVQEQVTLRSEHAEIERHAVERPLTGAEATNAFQERTLEIRETAEVPVIEKQAFVREEVGIRKDVDERVETISDTVRRTEVDIDRDETRLEGGSATTGEYLSEEERIRRERGGGSSSF